MPNHSNKPRSATLVLCCDSDSDILASTANPISLAQNSLPVEPVTHATTRTDSTTVHQRRHVPTSPHGPTLRPYAVPRGTHVAPRNVYARTRASSAWPHETPACLPASHEPPPRALAAREPRPVPEPPRPHLRPRPLPTSPYAELFARKQRPPPPPPPPALLPGRRPSV